MTAVELFLIFAMALNVWLGASVFLRNAGNSTNRFYLFLSLATFLWLLNTIFIINSDTAKSAVIFLQLATASAALLPLAFHLIGFSIQYEDESIAGILVHAKLHLIATAVAVALCFTPYLIRDVTMPSQSDTGSPFIEPKYGIAWFMVVIYMITMTVSLITVFFSFRKKLSGVRRTEMSFLLLATGTASVAGILFGPILSAVVNTTYLMPISNGLAIIILNSILAYAISTKNILQVDIVFRRTALYAIFFLIITIFSIVLWYVCDKLFPVQVLGRTILFPVMLAILLSLFLLPFYARISQRLNSLFKTSLNIPEDILTHGSHILQSITTTKELVIKSSLFLCDIMDARNVNILLCQNSIYKNQNDTFLLDDNSEIIKWLKSHKEPIASYALKRQTMSLALEKLQKEMETIGAHAVAGIFFKSELTGLIILGKHKKGDIYDKMKLDALWLFANEMGISLKNTELYNQVQNQKIYMESLLENLVNGVVAVDTERRITICNREAQRIIGIESADVDRNDCDLPEPLRGVVEELFENEHSVRNQELSIINERDEEVSLQLGGTLLYGHKGELIGALLVFNDQTAIKRLESQIRRSERLASAGQLAAGMAHEIKNPLVAIKTFAELLPTRYDDPEFRDSYSPLVGEEINRIDAIVNQLLDFARPSRPHSKPVHIHDIIARVLQLLKQQISKADITLNEQLHAKNDLVRGDANQIHQVFVNIILNAIAAMKKGNGRLTIRTDNIEWLVKEENSQKMNTPGPYINIAVSDTGCGMEEKEITKIFDPFYTNSAGGTGMGLPVAHGIVSEHQGVMNVESERGEGSTFTVALPIIHEESVV